MLSVVIPTYNNHHRLLLCLEGLGRQTDRAFAVHVVNDGGNEATSLIVDQVIDGSLSDVSVRYHYLAPADTNFRAAAARNLGLLHAHGARTLFLDQDCVADSDLLRGHHAYGNDQTVVVGQRRRIAEARLAEMRPSDVANIAWFADRDDERRIMTYGCYKETAERWQSGEAVFPTHYRACWGFQMSVPTALAKQLGGFWEEFNYYGNEDSELAWRLQQVGCQLLLDTRLVAYHLDHPQQKRNTKQQLALMRKSQKMPGLVRNDGPLV